MNGTRLQYLIYKKAGGISARHVGFPYSLFRPSGPTDPLDIGNARGTILAMQAADAAWGLTKPNLYGHPIWYPLLDGTQTQVWDYLVAADGSKFFIAGMQPLVPIFSVECNHVINLLRPAGVSGVGAQPYGGDVTTTEVPVMTGWPVSALTKSRGETGVVNLPGDVKFPWSEVLMPYAGVQILFGDVLMDELGVRHIVSSTELTDAGYRMLVVQATA